MLSVVHDQTMRPLGKKRRKTEGFLGSDAGLERIAQTIRDSLDEAKIPHHELGGIGIGCPGPLDLDRGVLREAPNLGWKDVPLADFLRREFACPAFLLNDVDAGVYGEFRFGSGVGARCVVGIFPGTGVGGGCVYEGRILRGATSSCLEIGHMQVVPEGPLCGCGRRGCLEAVASRLAIAAASAQAAFRGQAPMLMALCGTDVGLIRSGVLAEVIRGGETVVEQIVRQAARHLGVAAANVVNLLAPDVIVLGGGLVEAMPELFVDEVTAVARGRSLATLADSFRVVPAKLSDDAAVLGAAAWAQKMVQEAGA